MMERWEMISVNIAMLGIWNVNTEAHLWGTDVGFRLK
jgi:hypothetical protein